MKNKKERREQRGEMKPCEGGRIGRSCRGQRSQGGRGSWLKGDGSNMTQERG